MKKKLNLILLNWLSKAVIITILPFIIGLLDNATKWKDDNGNIINIFKSGKIGVVLLTFLYIIYIVYVAYNERKQGKEKQIINDLKEQQKNNELYIESYKNTLETMNNLMNFSKDKINDFTKKMLLINNANLLNLDLLNSNLESMFKDISTCICNDIVNNLKKLSQYETDISASIYLRYNKKSGKRNNDCIKMVAYYGNQNSWPSIIESEIILAKKKDYQYAKLFLKNNPKVVAYPTEEEIKENFAYERNPSEYDGEYTQYIGIPISCSEGHILSSLEIIAHHGTIIAETKQGLLEIVNKYIIVYRNYILLLHKIEKGLKSKNIDIEKEKL